MPNQEEIKEYNLKAKIFDWISMFLLIGIGVGIGINLGYYWRETNYILEGIRYHLELESRLELNYSTQISHRLPILNGNSLNSPRRRFIEDRVLGALGRAIIQCESNGYQNVVGKNGEIGVAQFLPSTWKWMTELAGYSGDIYNKKDQEWMLSWALENGYANHWTCFRLLTNR